LDAPRLKLLQMTLNEYWDFRARQPAAFAEIDDLLTT
jgi:hypothetical protein